MPFAVWYLAALPITLTLAGATKRHTLLGTAPLPGWRRFSTQYAAGCMAIIAVLLAAIAPSALFHLFQNGLGDPSYPLVFVREGELVESTALAAYLEALGMLVLGNLAILAAALGAAYLSRNGLVGAGVAVVLACVPLISDPGASTLLSEELMIWLPTSYLDFSRIVGYPTVFPAGEASEIPLAFSSGRGLAALAMWAAGLAGAFTLVAGGFGATRRAPRETEDETLCARDVRLAYGRHVVYDGADFALSLGQVAGFVAPNGWGKTTLMRTLSEQPLRGLRGRRAIELRVDGEPATDLLVRREVLYAASDAELLHPKLTVRDHLRIAKRLWGSEMDVREVAEALAIEDFLGRATRKLSQGMKQQVVLAVALISGARYVLLDEPTNGLDPAHVRRFERVVGELARSGRGVLVSSHLLSTIDSVCTGFYLIRDHRLVWLARRGRGTPDATRLKQLYAEFYGQGAGKAGGADTEAPTRKARGQPPPARARASALHSTPERTRTLERFTPNHEHGTHDHEGKTMDITKMQRLARILRIAITIFQILFIACIAITVIFITIYAMVVLPEGIRYQDYSFLGGFIYVENEFLVSDVGIIAMDVIPRIKTIVYLVLGTIALVFLKRIMRAAEAGRPFDPSVGANIKCLGIVCLVLWIFACVWGVFWTQYALGLEASGAVNGMTQFIESGKVTGDPEIYEFSLPADPPDANLPLLFGTLTLFLLSYVFNYGIELQKLSDETV